MANVIFTLEDTELSRKELSLLLQIDPSQLTINDGLISVLCIDSEEKMLSILSRAISSYGLVPLIDPPKTAPVQAVSVEDKPVSKPSRPVQTKGNSK